MPVVPKLDRVLDLRFYTRVGVSSRTIFARLESNLLEYAARSSPTRTMRRRYRVRYDGDILAGLLQPEVDGPVRVVGEGVELVVRRVEEMERRKWLVLDCEGVAQLE